MYNWQTSFILIISIIGIILTLIKCSYIGLNFIFKKAEETSLSYVRKIESDRGEFALLIQSLQHQVELMSKRIDELENRRQDLEKDNRECMEEVKLLRKQLKEC